MFGGSFDKKSIMQAVLAGEQAKAIANYVDRLNQWKQACEQWKISNVINRDNHLPLTPSPAIPTRTILDLDDNLNLIQHEEQDPSLLPPSLPPVILNVGGGGFHTDAGSNTDTQNALLMGIYSTVTQLNAKVDMLLKK